MDDSISRRAAIDTLNDVFTITGKANAVVVQDYIRRVNNRLHDLPSAQPERKTGKWVHGREIGREMIGDAITAIWYEGWQCSECKCIVEEEREPLWKFCPNCGSKMLNYYEKED